MNVVELIHLFMKVTRFSQHNSVDSQPLLSPSVFHGLKHKQMSILEIYNENVVDLLSPANSCEPVEIRHSNQSVSIVGATWVPVKDEVDMHNAISMGQRGRHVAETKLNSSSSRSHLIVSVCVVGTDRISGAVSRGQLTLCDLAGSERIEKSGVTSGERFQEATYINRSLSALAQTEE
ncbi:kinesin motor domain protein [Opisthorchis viverrini]|uniref:Kinesin motor domain protein n=1 Tax=Opisthorchis viverrini TaxID=6198 RepID=A0A1S8WMA5_OPIVI|nr:kinesin motor domain protein [Opisthorchis viverrini]